MYVSELALCTHLHAYIGTENVDCRRREDRKSSVENGDIMRGRAFESIFLIKKAILRTIINIIDVATNKLDF